MLADLPPWAIVVLNLISIPAIHLGVSLVFVKLPRSGFNPDSFVYRERAWERGGKLYERGFLIRSWKPLLPDAAPWFKGFAKGNLASRDKEYIRTFIEGYAPHAIRAFRLKVEMKIIFFTKQLQFRNIRFCQMLRL